MTNTATQYMPRPISERFTHSNVASVNTVPRLRGMEEREDGAGEPNERNKDKRFSVNSTPTSDETLATVNRETALYWAGLGVRVLPCREVPGVSSKGKPLKEKRPYGDCVPHAAASATTDQETIKQWWREHPEALPGLASGELFDVIDVDVKNGRPGVQTFKEVDAAGLVAETRCYVDTPSGGRHVYVPPTGDKILTDPKAPARSRGIDYRGAGCFVIAPGAVLPSGEFWSPQDGDALDWESVLARLAAGAPVPFVKKYKARWLGRTSKPGKAVRAEGGALGCILAALRERSWLGLHKDPSEPGHYRARCPVHGMTDGEHSSTSLSVGPGGHAEYVLHCYADCDAGGVLGALGLSDLARRHYIHAQAMGTEDDTGDDDADRVAKKVKELRINRLARQADVADSAAAGWSPPVVGDTGGLMSEMLARPRQEQKFLVDSLVGLNHNAVVGGQYKTGKTLWGINLVAALVDKEPFLGRNTSLPPDSNVMWWNAEMDDDDFAGYVRPLGIVHPERIHAWHLRGRRMPIMNDYVMEWVINDLRSRGISVWVVDSWRRLCSWSGVSENSNEEVEPLTERIDHIKAQAGVHTFLTLAHTGRAEQQPGEEHVRGATAVDDWADARLMMAKKDGRRYLYASPGRFIEFEEQALMLNPVTLRVSLGTGNRKQVMNDSQTNGCLAYIAEHSGKATAAVVKDGLQMSSNNNSGLAKLLSLERRGDIHHIDGANNGRFWYLGERPEERPCTCGKADGFEPRARDFGFEVDADA